MKRLLIIMIIALTGATSVSGHVSQQMSDSEARMYIMKHLEKLRMAICTKDITSVEDMLHKDFFFLMKKQIMRTKNGDTFFVDTVMKVSRNQFLEPLKKAFISSNYIDARFSSADDDGGEDGYGITRSNIDPTKYGVRLRLEWRSSRYGDTGYLFLLWEFPKNGGTPVIQVLTWQPEMVAGQKVQPDPDITTLAGFNL